MLDGEPFPSARPYASRGGVLRRRDSDPLSALLPRGRPPGSTVWPILISIPCGLGWWTARKTTAGARSPIMSRRATRTPSSPYDFGLTTFGDGAAPSRLHSYRRYVYAHGAQAATPGVRLAAKRADTEAQKGFALTPVDRLLSRSRYFTYTPLINSRIVPSGSLKHTKLAFPSPGPSMVVRGATNSTSIFCKSA